MVLVIPWSEILHSLHIVHGKEMAYAILAVIETRSALQGKPVQDQYQENLKIS